MQLPLEEYFKYHPPTTPERIALHERVNRDSLEICRAFIAATNTVEILAIRDAAILLADEVCHDGTCLDWAKEAIQTAVRCASIDPIGRQGHRTTSILMHVQQFRMFLNQGVTVDELKQKQYDGINLTFDGDRWCALIGENLQVGIAGGGKDPLAALSDLYVTLKGIEFTELKNSSGDIYSTSIKSIEFDPEREDKYRPFINAWGNAIANLDANGLRDRDTLIAELAATEEFEAIEGGGE